MSEIFEDQTLKRKQQIFKSALRFQESAAGVSIQRVSGSYLYRILKPVLDARRRAYEGEDNHDSGTRAWDAVDPADHNPDPSDKLINEIYNMDRTFSGCKTKSLDMLSSAESIAMEWKERGAPGHGCLLLAWKTAFDPTSKKLQPAVLVGAATLHKFVSSVNFSTDHESAPNRGSLGDSDYKVLTGQKLIGSNEKRNYFSRNTMYIDGLCAKGKGGIGKILILHALLWGIMRKCTGVIALSFSTTQKQRPESYSAFVSLGFASIIPAANYKISRMYGTWFFMSIDSIGLTTILKDVVDVCTRKGFTNKTSDTLVMRCHN